jgi:Sulfotransferase domain
MPVTGDALDGARSTSGERGGRLPNFLVIGAMKAGTTSLFHYLGAHPDAYLSPLKEVEFFVDGKNWRRGLEWYRAQFADASSDALAIGEASTAYTKFPEYDGVPERIASVLPDARLIYLVRDPIERIRSHYQHRVLSGAERAPMRTAVLEDPRYIDCSRYAMQLERYLPHFAREQILLVTSEDLRSRRAETIGSVYRFLSLDESVGSDVFAHEFYRSEDRKKYPPVAWWVRRVVKRYVPAGKRIKELVDGARPGSRPTANDEARDEPSSFTVPNDVRRRLAELLHDDVQRLRAHMPPGFDGWGIA